MAMPSKDDRLRIQHARIENEKQYLRQKKLFESDLGDKVSDISRQELMIMKQHERLENEKQYNKTHSHLTKDRKLAERGHETPESSQQNFREVKSKLFDYEKSSPRSRRQLIESGSTTPALSPTPRSLATHAIEANKTSHRDIVHHLTLTRDKRSVSREHHDARELTPTPTPRIDRTDLEERVSRRGLHQPEFKVTFNDDRPDTRLYRVKSLEHHGKSPTPKAPRRHSEFVPAIHVIDAKRDDVGEDEDDAVKLQDLYNKAIETVKQTDESLLSGAHNKVRNTKDRRLSDHKSKSGFDVNALKELEHILNDARTYSSRKSSKEDHSRLDLGSNRAQKKRIEHLEQVLKQLNPKYGDSSNEMDPFQVLQCSYLRLSKSNIKTLEEMIRNEGKDPGIHIHSDVTDYDIWQNIQNERTDLKKDRESKSDKQKKNVKVEG